MKRLIAMLLTVSVLLLSVPAAFGADTISDTSAASSQFHEYEGFFETLGIFEGLSEEVLDSEHVLTRAEFATIAANMTGLGNVNLEDVYSKFSDVDDTYWAVDAIKMISELGYINGNVDGTFAPEDSISYMQAVKILVSMLGYDAFAVSRGGYPTGYLMIAQEKEITLGSNPNDEALNFDVAASLIYNTLNTDVLITAGGERAEYYTLSGETLLKRNLRVLRAEEQIITANEYTTLSGESELQEGEIMAGGTVYSQGETDASRYLGYCANLYYVEDGSKNTLVYIEADDRYNEEEIVKADSILGYTNHILTAEDANGKELRYKVSESADIIYNGKSADYDASLFDLDCGTVTFLDNSSDGDYDVISIRTFEDIVIGALDYMDQEIYNKYPLRDKNGINIDPYSMIDLTPDTDASYLITNQTGEVLVFEDLSVGDLISVYISQDGAYKEVVVCTEKITGSVSEMSADTVVIGGLVYEWSDYIMQTQQQLRLNEEGTFRLNIEGRIAEADFTGVTSMRYGYLIDMRIKEGLDGGYQLKLLDEDGTIHYHDIGDKVEIDGESYTTANVMDKNFLWTDSQLIEAGYVDKNGEYTVAPGTFKRQLVRYRCDKDSVVKEIDTATVSEKSIDTELTQITPNGLRADRRFKQYAKSFQLEFNISDQTKLFRVPDNAVDATTKQPVNDSSFLDDDENFDCVDPTAFVHDRLYAVEGYDFGDGFVAKAAVVYIKGVEEVSDVSTLALVDRVTKTYIDEDGEEGYKLYCLANGKFSEYYAKASVMNMPDAGGRLPMQGDVIRFSTDKNNRITNITLDLDITTLDKTQGNYKGTFMSNFYEFMGPVTGKGNGYFTVKGRKSDATGDVYLTPLLAGSFYVYDSENGQIRNGSQDDLICADSASDGASYVLVRMGYETCKEVVIFK